MLLNPSNKQRMFLGENHGTNHGHYCHCRPSYFEWLKHRRKGMSVCFEIACQQGIVLAGGLFAVT
jgi:hypothetical protein